MNYTSKLLTSLSIAAVMFSANVNAGNQTSDTSTINPPLEKVHVFDSDVVDVEYVSGVVITTENELSTFKDGSESYLSNDGNCYKTTNSLIKLKENKIQGHVFFTKDSNAETVLIECPSRLKF